MRGSNPCTNNKSTNEFEKAHCLTVEDAVNILAGVVIGALINIAIIVEYDQAYKQQFLLEELIKKLNEKV